MYWTLKETKRYNCILLARGASLPSVPCLLNYPNFRYIYIYILYYNYIYLFIYIFQAYVRHVPLTRALRANVGPAG